VHRQPREGAPARRSELQRRVRLRRRLGLN
jgi:hypothetical protein